MQLHRFDNMAKRNKIKIDEEKCNGYGEWSE
jgi:hypothetical protein